MAVVIKIQDPSRLSEELASFHNRQAYHLAETVEWDCRVLFHIRRLF